MDLYMNDNICKPNGSCVFRQTQQVDENTWKFIYVEESELKNIEDEYCFHCGKKAVIKLDKEFKSNSEKLQYLLNGLNLKTINLKTILMTDLLKSKIHNYFTFKSYAKVLKVEEGEVDKTKCYVKIKCELDYYIHDENYHIIDINFKEQTINGFINLNKL